MSDPLSFFMLRMVSSKSQAADCKEGASRSYERMFYP
jgi:hypothetical protein